MPKFVKGSQEAKDFMAKIRASRGKPKDPNAPPKKLTKKQQQKALAESAMVKIQQVGEDELIVPQFFAKRLAPSKKKAVRFRLVNPITQERHLATRNGQTVVKISRRPTAETLIIGDDPTPIPLSAFSRADQERPLPASRVGCPGPAKSGQDSPQHRHHPRTRPRLVHRHHEGRRDPPPQP